MIVRFPCNIHVSGSESQILFLHGHGVKIGGKLALRASESGYMSHSSTKLSKVLTLSGLRAPIPLVRNKVAIIYAYGSFFNKIYLLLSEKIQYICKKTKYHEREIRN